MSIEVMTEAEIVTDETDDGTPEAVKTLSEITSLDEYLKRFGPALGQSAAERLDPMHKPGITPLPDFSEMVDFNPKREPFEAQKHVIAGTIKMMNAYGSGFIVGEMGCIAGESEVYDPVAGIYRRVDEISEPFHVVSHHKGKAVTGKAHVPFVKGTRDLYRVTLSNGQDFIATDHHRILTDHGYQLVSVVAGRIRESGPVPLPSIEDTSLSVSPRDGGRSSRTPSGCRDGCRQVRRSGDGRLPSASEAARESLPRRVDARGRSRQSSPSGVLVSESEHTHACPSSDPRSTTRSESLAGCSSLAVASEPRPFSEPCEQDGGLCRDGLRSPGGSCRPDTTESSPRSASQSGCESPSEYLGEFVSESVHVTDVVYERTGIYYDFTVEEFHNYVMAGVVHHNTGKTLIAIHAVHLRATGGKPRPKGLGYRACFLVPDHLLGKTEREILHTIPGAVVRRFDSWKDFIHLYAEKRSDAKGKNGKALWKPATEPEWYIIGRDQSKHAPTKIGTPTRRELRITGNPMVPTSFGGLSARQVPVDTVNATDENGQAIKDKWGYNVRKTIHAKAYCCPKCGNYPYDKKTKLPVGPDEINGKSLFCEGLYLKEIVPESKSGEPGKEFTLERIYSSRDHLFTLAGGDLKEGKIVTIGTRQFIPIKCGEALWQYTRKPNRWPPARFIHRKMQGFFDDLIVDEVHEQESATSAQANACGALIGASKRVLCLTGTLIGGKSSDIFPIMFRAGFPNLKKEGYDWDGVLEFAKQYGIVETTMTQKFGGEVSFSSNKSSSMKKESADRTSSKIAPGTMPHMFGNHMLGRSIFISLEGMADGLPDLIEHVGTGPEGNTESAEYNRLYAESWIQTNVEMDEEQADEYKRINQIMDVTVREMVQKGSMKFLGAYLHTAMQYPDMPYGWVHSPELKYAIKKESEKRHIDLDANLVSTVGYWDKPGSTDLGDYTGVVTPADLDAETIRPKEQALIDICKMHKKKGNQVWVYVQMTGKHDCQPRLKRLLEAQGLSVEILRSKAVKPTEREEWINKNGKKYDVIISFPKLVSTGLDLFCKNGGHNYNVLVFYQTGYSLFTLRQAARRAWRIGQKKTCFVYYLYYKGTMQERGMKLMSRKLGAAAALDGEYSLEGLVGMSDSVSDQMAMVRGISESIKNTDIGRNWGKIRSGGDGEPIRDNDFIDVEAEDVLPDDDDTEDMDEMARQVAQDFIDMDDDFGAYDIEDWDDVAPVLEPPKRKAITAEAKSKPIVTPEPGPVPDDADEDEEMRLEAQRFVEEMLANGLNLDLD
jgi:hypothetical protein